MHADDADRLNVYLQFLLEVLQAIADRGGNEQVVYPLLEANIDKLNLNLAEVLRHWATNELTRVAPDEAQDIAGNILIFSALIQQFPLGNRANNIEIAIAGYEMALIVFTRDEIPEDWAMTQSNMGTAYRDRIIGNRAENIEKAIAIHTAVLEVRTRGSEEWAGTQMNLGAAYLGRIVGNTADNLEKAIDAFTAALEVFTRDKFPQQRVMIQNNLGVAYRNRIIGDRADNIEKAIATGTDALEVCTSHQVHQQWAAMAQITLGNAYSERIRGNRADNLEEAIQAYTAALEFYTRDTFPQPWAMIQNNLGNVYLFRILGDRADDVEKAITACNAALEVRSRDAFPLDWAETQNNLGNAYLERIFGEKAQNIERAIAVYTDALNVYTRNSFPQRWALIQNNLGVIYRNRIVGDKGDNLERAIAACNAALEVYTCDAFPQPWAATQNTLASAYYERILGDRADNLERAIAACNEVLKVYTSESFPEYWATTQDNLGNAYRKRILGDEAENIELAIEAFTAALKVRTREDLPQYWAMTQINLGTAYRDRKFGDEAENIQLAINAFTDVLEVLTPNSSPYSWAAAQNNLGGACWRMREHRNTGENIVRAFQAYSAALEVYTRDAFPINYVETKYNLGTLYQDGQRFTDAYATFRDAIETVELLREEIISGSETKRRQAEQWQLLYLHMVEICLAQGNITKAIEYAERSKTRNLVELILNRDSETIFPTDVVQQLKQLRNEIAIGQDKIQNGTAINPRALAQHLQELRQQRNELQDKYLLIGSSFNLKQFQANLNEQTAIIQWYITTTGCETFIITRSHLQRLNTSKQDSLRNDLLDYFQKYFTDYYQNRTAWSNSFNSHFTHLATILQIEDILDKIPKSCSCLILIPHVFLHLFPLHALPLPNGQFLFEQFSNGVSYAPSCQLLQQIQERERPNFQSIFAIQNPTEDLGYTNVEVENILPLFSSHQVLSKSQATKASIAQALPNLQQVNYLHFSCHGYFNLDSPESSFLLLADAYVSSSPADADPEKYLKTPDGRIIDLSKCLTLGNLFERDFNLNQCRLVILSACETGMTDILSVSDEYIGLPSGFLYAGSSCVVSSLWTVNDKSTAYLMIKFLQNLQEAFTLGQDVSIAVALNQAQKWLRDITWEDLEKWQSSLQPLDITKDREVRVNRPQSENLTSNKPFESPYYWAAFTAIGK
ncbi:CHAT domain-containing protein [Scytonema sp. UIC 10036]|uniref:CHAT domain-containing protein n=1 Tax=Scytonema sp. UIC 10036 TaxID=2304196 RepID=UPI0012DAEA50|nr:CHAT domain-containing protein [Scytonema sp. UIC 10036]MUG92859.1 CHAT domain-containing protein [Scytonema sp. UIC 10036]